MITVTESGKSIVEINLPDAVFGGFEQVKDFLKSTTQQTKESLAATSEKTVNTITTLTDTVDTVSATAKNSLEQTLQKANQVSSFTSNSMQTAITSSVNDWLQAHPTILQLMQILIWATNHPIVSLVISIFGVAIAWSLIKVIVRLFEHASLFLLQAPFKLIQFLIAVSTKSLGKVGIATKQPLITNTAQYPVLQHSTATTYQDKQQRLAGIANRLEAIQKEQNELLQEVKTILNSDEVNIDLKSRTE